MHHVLGKLCSIGFRLFMEETGLKKQLQNTAKKHAVELGSVAQKLWLDGKVAIEKDNYRKALEYLNKAVEKDPNNVAYLVDRGIAKFKLGNLLGAIEDYAAARAINPITFADIEQRQNGIPGL